MVYLAAAMIVLWLAVGLYVAFLLVRQRKLEQELELLEEEMGEHQARERPARSS